jgi:hypothetical protein
VTFELTRRFRVGLRFGGLKFNGLTNRESVVQWRPTSE